MRNIKEDFLYLLRLGLWGHIENEKEVSLSRDEWIAIYQMSVKQTVQGLVFDGIQLLPVSQQPEKEIQYPWLLQLINLEHQNKQQIAQLIELQYFFENENHLPFRLLKGQGIARLYRNGLHRICGDFDLWFGPAENVEKANQLIESKGIHVVRGEYDDGEYNWFGTDVEHHCHLIELHNPFKEKELMAWEKMIYQTSSDVPEPCANLLLQITHILKHQLNEGIGLRQICDLAVSLKGLDYNAEDLQKLCKKYGVYRWTKLLLSLINKVLGVPQKELPFPCDGNPECLLDEIWESGNFGHYDTRFGNRPTGKWASKLYTANIIFQKMKIFFFYVPEESFWWTSRLVGLRFLQALHLK